MHEVSLSGRTFYLQFIKYEIERVMVDVLLKQLLSAGTLRGAFDSVCLEVEPKEIKCR